jgi:Right handed beta helix region
MKTQTSKQLQPNRWPLFFLISFALMASNVAWSADGLIEINQARALAGSLNGDPLLDPPGFPVHLSEGGSYILTSDLIVPTADTSAIALYTAAGAAVADPVSLDLNGFSIVGPGTCTGEGSAISCSESTGVGIDTVGVGTTIVRNGRISGFGTGVWLRTGDAGGCILRDLVVAGNTNIGIVLSGYYSPCIVSGSDVRKNGTYGLVQWPATIVRDSTIRGNGENGLQSQLSPLAAFRATIRGNGGRGINLNGRSLMVVDSSIGFNTLQGVLTGASPHYILLGNSIYGNTGNQLEFGACGAFSNSVIASGGGGTTVVHPCPPSISMGPNLCDGSLTCP